MTDHYDVIVIGSGAGGGTLTHALAPTGKRILLLERGDFLPREPQNWDSKSAGLLSLTNATFAILLVGDLARGAGPRSAAALLLAGGALWTANVLIFALWYWELDRGGPADRCHAVRMYPDFAFPQLQQPGLAPEDWRPAFTDYLYLSFINAISFSAGDVAPLTRWAKLMMMLQSAISVAAIALVIARAVNILG
jgi:hypothetical protein